MRSLSGTLGGQRLNPSVPGRGFWFMRDIPTVGWLVAAVVTATLTQPPHGRWLLIHLLLLGAVTHAILVWSQYFSFALLRSRASVRDRREQNARLLLANTGALLVVVGGPYRLWLLTALGAGLLIAAVAWHGVSLVARVRGSLPGQFGHTVRFYVAAAGFLVIGAVLGALMAIVGRGGGLAFAHALVNLLGWVGLTVAGTLVTFWPTVLRTRADPQAALGASRALPLLVVGALLAAIGAAVEQPLALVAGLGLYLVGLAVLGVIGWRTARRSPPKSFAALSIACAFAWWCGALVSVTVRAVAAWWGSDPAAAADAAIRAAVPFLAAGFAAQVLLGALSYLVPVVLGGGPGPVREATAVLNRLGVLRVTALNLALLATALVRACDGNVTLPSAIDGVLRLTYLAAVASFLVVLFAGMRTQRRAKARVQAQVHQQPPTGGAGREARDL